MSSLTTSLMPLACKILTSAAHAALIEKDVSAAQEIAVAFAMNLAVTARSILPTAYADPRDANAMFTKVATVWWWVDSA